MGSGSLRRPDLVRRLALVVVAAGALFGCSENSPRGPARDASPEPPADASALDAGRDAAPAEGGSPPLDMDAMIEERDGGGPRLDASVEPDASEEAGADAGDAGDASFMDASFIDADVQEPDASPTCSCPIAEPRCESAICTWSGCLYSRVSYGVALPADRQEPGDCLVVACDGLGGTLELAASDPPEHANACLEGYCAGTEPGFTNRHDRTLCPGGACFDGECEPASCTDGVRDGDETDQDCGGGCDPCGEGQGCAVADECESRVCSLGLCAAPSCSDTKHNGSETDVDCGGPCPACAPGQQCDGDEDCASQVCASDACAAPSCSDSVRNGGESAVDCGGACDGCALGSACAAHDDCLSGYCGAGSLCRAPACDDLAQNGDETDLDCGGNCDACARGRRCADDGDCDAESECQAGRCAVELFAIGSGYAFPLIGAAESLLSDDFDGDGHADVVTLHGGDTGELHVYFGAGQARVRDAIALELPYGAIDATAADFDGDGDIDLVSALGAGRNGTGYVCVNRWSPAGFAQAQCLPHEHELERIAVGDLDGDGDVDAAATDYFELTLFRQGTGGQLEEWQRFTGWKDALRIFDVDADGDLDVVGTYNSNGSELTTLLNDGSGAFSTTPIEDGFNLLGIDIAVGRFGVDRDVDIATTGRDGFLFAVHENAGGGRFPLRTVLPQPQGIDTSYGQSFDLDSNGLTDVLGMAEAVEGPPTPYAIAWEQGPASAFSPRELFQLGTHPYGMAIARTDADCHPDIAVRTSSTLTLWPGQANGTYFGPQVASIPGYFTGAGDADGDGDIDFAGLGKDSTGDMLFWARNDGGALHAIPQPIATGVRGFGIESFALGDLNGDGHADAVVGRTNTATHRVEVWLNTGAITTFALASSINASCTRPRPTTADLDGDGDLDVAVACRGEDTAIGCGGGGRMALLNDGTGALSLRYAAGDACRYAAVAAELTGDGFVDLALQGATTVAVYRNDGMARFGTTYASIGGVATGGVAAGDIDGDGGNELAITYPEYDVVEVYRRAGSSFSPSDAAYTLDFPYGVAMGDLDLDGLADVVVADRRSHAATVVRSAGGALAGPVHYQAQHDAWQPALADVDGDGLLDIAVAGSQLSVLPNVSGTPLPTCPVCGDGAVDYPEGCDSGSQSDPGCIDCRLSFGYACQGAPSVCHTVCGDGLVVDQACDDGNTDVGDGCDASCAIELGYACTLEPSDCRPICGDTLVRGSEICDDGNTIDDASCPRTCRQDLWTKSAPDVGAVQGVVSAATPDGGLVIAGSYSGAPDFGLGPLTSVGSQDAFIARFDPDGAPIYSVRFGAAGSYVMAGDIAVDAAGNAYLAAAFTGTIDFGTGPLAPDYQDLVILSVGTAGAVRFAHHYPGEGSTQPMGLAVDGDTLLVTGAFQGELDFGSVQLESAGMSDLFIARLSAAGSAVWANSYGSETGRVHHSSIARAPDGGVVVAGSYHGSYDFGFAQYAAGDGADPMVIKLNGSGVPQWGRHYERSNTYDFIYDLALGADGSIHLAGSHQGEIDFGGGELPGTSYSDAYVAKLNAAGQHVFTRSLGGNGVSQATGIAVTASGDVLVTGSFDQEIDLLGETRASAGSDDMFVVKLSPLGATHWRYTFGDGGMQRPSSASATPSGRGFVAGTFGGTLDFGWDPLESPYTQNAFFIQLAP